MLRARFQRSIFVVRWLTAAGCWSGAWAYADQGVADRVAGHLAAGEFGLAKRAVAQETDPVSRDALLKQVVDAQFRANEQIGSLGQSLGGSRRPSERPNPSRVPKTGGGVQADFDSLIEMIQSQTSGKWKDNGGSDTDGTINPHESGIRVDAHGLLSAVSQKDATGRLAALGLTARHADLNADLAKPAGLRMVSLNRLQREVAALLADGQPIGESMRRIGGLTQIRYIFVVPEDNDVVLAGPAEGWVYNAAGIPVGETSHRPPLNLDDLVVTLRTFSPGAKQIFGCSIDPRPEGLQAIKAFTEQSQKRGSLNPGEVGQWAATIGKALGQQNISIYGVPADSRVARTLIEADYRMKLIGVGKLDGGPHIPDYFRLLAKQPNLAKGGLDALRWWLTLKYDAILNSEDHNAFEITGSAVLCRSENEHINATGERVGSGKAEPINQQFATNFTTYYEELAKQDPVFADLQGVFDLAVAAAILQRENVDERIHWNRGVFATNGEYRPASYNVPKHCESVVNYRVFNGKDIVVQVAGGVRADIASVVKNPELNKTSTQPTEAAPAARPTEKLPAGRWWWDAK